MKPLYVLSILLGLCACSDKPIFVQNDLWCVDHDNGTREKATIEIPGLKGSQQLTRKKH